MTEDDHEEAVTFEVDLDALAAASSDPTLCGCIVPKPKPCQVCDWWAGLAQRITAPAG